MPADPIPALLAAADPLLGCRVRAQLLDEDVSLTELRQAAARSPVVQALLAGGFPAEKTWHQTAADRRPNSSRAHWGGAGKRRMNPFVTADALLVLRRAGDQGA